MSQSFDPVSGTVPARSASVALVLATVALDALGFGIVVPVVPNLVMQLEHVSAGQASFYMGLLLAAFSVMQFLCAPLLGGLSDRFGRRPVLLAALGGMCLNYLLLVWAPSLAWLLLGRVIAGATAASYSTATAYIADVTPPELRAQRFGLVGAMFGLGFVAGPGLGGLLGSYGLRWPFVLAAVLAGANVLFALLMLPESLPPERRRAFAWSRANPLGSMQMLTVDGSFRRLALAWCCTWFALGTVQASFVLANELRLGWGAQENGLSLAVVGIGSALVQGLMVRRIVLRLGERWTALIGYTLSAAAYVAFAWAWDLRILLVGIVLLSLGAISGPSVQSMLSMRVGKDAQGEIQGALASVQGLTAIVAPLLAGWVFSMFADPHAGTYFPGAPFLMAALAYIIAVASVWTVPRIVQR